jgi:hypothetical protein
MAVKFIWPSVLTLLSAALTLLIIPSSARRVFVRRAECPVPNWAVDAINVTYSDDTDTPGNAAFVLSNSLTNNTEALTCPLTFNTLCQILGTFNDETLQILLQVNIDVAFITLNQSWTCHDQLNQSITYVISLLSGLDDTAILTSGKFYFCDWHGHVGLGLPLQP